MKLLSIPVTVIAAVTLGMGLSIARADDSPPVFNDRMGISTHFASSAWNYDVDQLMPMIAKTHVGWIRDDLWWGHVEKTKGTYVIPEESLKWIKAVHRNGLKLNLLISGSCKLYDDPFDADAFSHFAAAMAEQLRGDVDAFEILNEPANSGFSKYYGGTWNGYEKDGSISPWVGKYVTVLNRAAEAIKAVNPKVKVIGLGSVPPVNFRQLAMGISPKVDGITDHPYSFRFVPEQLPYSSSDGILKRDGIIVADEHGTFVSNVRLYRETSAKYSGPHEMWLTEWGFPTYQPVAPSLYAGVTYSAQAKYLLRRFIECFGLNIDKSFFYCFKDRAGSPHDPEYNFGLVDTQSNPKPALAAITRVALVTNGFTADPSVAKVTIHPMGDRTDRWPMVWDEATIATPGNIPCYCFKDSAGTPVIAIWSAERADGDLMPRIADIQITAEHPIKSIDCLDMLTGEKSTLQFSEKDKGVIIKRMTVPDYPLLLTLH